MTEIVGSVSNRASYYKYYLEVVEGDYDVVSNSSPVTATIKIDTNYSETLAIRQASATHTITIDGTNYTITTGSYTLGNNNTVTLGSATKVVTHDDDGSKKITVSASSPDLAQGNGWGPYSGSASGQVTLITIPRASTVTCADGNIGSSTTINIVRANENFTHTLKYQFGSLSGTIVTKTNSTSYGWTIPTTFYAQIPNAKSGQGTIICETYNGNTLIGESECPFNAIVLETNNTPTITATIVDDNSVTKALTGDANKLIKYFSNAKVTITATAKNSATIVSQKVTCGGQSRTTATSTIEAVESGIFELSCIDSRGFLASDTITKTMIDYIKLAITSLTVTRQSSTSNTVTVNLRGNYYNGSFSSSTSNTLTLRWRYKIKDGSWSGYTTVTATLSGNTFSYNGTLATNFDYKQAYEIEIVAQDKLMTDTKSRPVDKGTPLIDMGEEDIIVNGEMTADEFKGTFTGDLTGNITGNASTATKLNTVTLYNNTLGTSGTVTLSETSANFTYIKIYYRRETTATVIYDSVEIYSPNGKTVGLKLNYSADASSLQTYSKMITISGTSITKIRETRVTFSGENSSVQESDSIYITRVDGYR